MTDEARGKLNEVQARPLDRLSTVGAPGEKAPVTE